MNVPLPRERQPRLRPLLDLRLPARLQTATFALG